MAELTPASHHHDDFASSPTASCSTSTSYVHYDILINHCGEDPDACTFATKLYRQLISRDLKVFLHKPEYMFKEEEVTSQMEAAFSFASVHIAIFSPSYAQWKWCLDALVRMTKPGVTILPIFYKVEPFQVRWTGKDNHGPYAQWLHDHEEKERYDSQTIQNWRDVLSHVSEISGFELKACNRDDEELLREVVKGVYKDFPCLRYHVFLNHRGPDSKSTLASQLYDRLTSCGLRVFLDKPELVEGFKIDSQIEVAIQFASVHIAIFSPKYAQSSWCLDELYLMIKSGAIILPVFYKMKSSVLDGEYAKDVADHENSKRYKSDNIQRWRSALSEVAKIKCFFEMDGNDEGVLNEIVQSVLKNVPDRSQVVHSSEVQTVVKGVLKQNVPRNSIVVVESDPEGYFGLAERLIDFENAMLSQQKERVEVKVVGVVGAAGFGKTALANLFFTRKRKDYKEYAFLSYVKDKGFTISLDHSHSDLIERFKHSPHQSVMLLKHLLSFCHALIIVDADQLDDFLPIKSVLDPIKSVLDRNSLILVTSRDKDLLRKSGIVDSSIYHLDGLTKAHSRNLFCFYAFSQLPREPRFADLVDDFLTACDGWPLWLKAFGGLLRDKDISLWEKQLNELDNCKLPLEMCRRFGISYDSLNQEEQQIFLDIACFFTGQDRDKATRIWGVSGVSSLENKCIVQVDHQNKIKMHNHFRDFGRNIAKGLRPGRLWHQTTNNIEVLLEQSSFELSRFRGITMIPHVEFRGLSNKTESQMRYHFQHLHRAHDHEVFHGPKNLKFLAAQDGYVEDILSRVGSPGLIWLHWYNCPYSNLPSEIPMENLRVLEVEGSQLTELWRQESQAPLQLRELNICAPLSVFPKSIGQLKHLEKIVVECYARSFKTLETLPEELGGVLSLKHLELRYCSRIRGLPDFFYKLTNLQYIDLEGASSLYGLPDSICTLSLLKHLCLKDCRDIRELRVVEHLTSLEMLDVSGCENLYRIPELWPFAKLQTLNVSRCRDIRGLPGVKRLTSLERLDVSGCEKLHSIPGLGRLAKLQTLNASGCRDIQELTGVERLTSLKRLDLSGCEKLQSLPGLGQLTKLRTLNVQECREIQELSGVEYLTSLETLNVKQCKKLENIQGLGQLTKLQTLNVRGCSNIRELPGMEHVTALETLDVRGCEKLQSIPALGQLTKLRLLYVEKDQEFPAVQECRVIQEFPAVQECRVIQELPSVEHVTSLDTLDVSGCGKLQCISGLGHCAIL